MTYIDNPEIILNVQIWFRKNKLVYLPNDDNVWQTEFRDWLFSQGCTIHHDSRNLVTNALGISPYYDKLRFENDADAVWFILRWS